MILTQLDLFTNKINSLRSFLELSTSEEREVYYTSEDELERIWISLQEKYFPEAAHIRNCKVVWSNRHQTTCLASVNLQRKIVRVAPAMKLKESYYFLSPLLYHEMCHVIVGIRVERGRRKIHTREFKTLEKQNPDIHHLDQWIKSGGWHKAVRKAKKIFAK